MDAFVQTGRARPHVRFSIADVMAMGNGRFVSHSEAETAQFGTALGKVLPPGMVVALDGELGAGKTQLVRAVCDGLGATEVLVNSPTFVLMQLYPGGRLPVAHFDTYRLADIDEFLAIGGEDYLLDSNTVCLVEWAQRIEDVLPADRITIRIQHLGETSREFRLSAGGSRSLTVLKEITAL